MTDVMTEMYKFLAEGGDLDQLKKKADEQYERLQREKVKERAARSNKILAAAQRIVDGTAVWDDVLDLLEEFLRLHDTDDFLRSHDANDQGITSFVDAVLSGDDEKAKIQRFAHRL